MSNQKLSEGSRGFTLVELLIYSAISVIAAGLLIAVLITTIRVENNAVVTSQVSQELNLILTTVQRLVRDASLVECVGPANQSSCNTSSGASGSLVRLRFSNQAVDPTCVYLENNIIKIAQGPEAVDKHKCNLSSAQNLTTDKVNNPSLPNSLSFTKFDVAGGHATLQVDAQLTYNSTNPSLQISKTLKSAVGRVSAATFDSDLLPDSTGSNRNIGSATALWQNISISKLLNLGTSATDIGSPVPVAGSVYYNTTSNRLKVYTGSAWDFISRWASLGSNIYFDTGNVGIGTNDPHSTLDVKGSLRLSGATSGYFGLQVPAVAGSTTYTLPSAAPSANGQFLSSATDGTLSWAAGIKSFYIPVTNSTNGLTGVDGTITYLSMPDSATTNAYARFYAPTAPTSIQVVGRAVGASAGNVVFDYGLDSFSDNAANQTDTATSIVVSDYSSSAATQLVTVSSTAYDGMTAGRAWQFRVTRQGGNASDTLTQAINLYGVIVNF